MKLKIALLAVTLSLTGCAVPHGDNVSSNEVGQVKYLGGSGLVYSKANRQFSQSSVAEGEAYLAKRQEETRQALAYQAEQKRQAPKPREMSIEQKCELGVAMRRAELYNRFQQTLSRKEYRAYTNFEPMIAFEQCVKGQKVTGKR